MSQENSQTSEHALIARIQAGDPEAFRELYDRHARLIYRYVALKVGQPQDVEDITAETFIKAWQALPAISPARPPSSPG